MKYSGIEWIGVIPDSWNVCRLKDIKSDIPYAIVDGPFGSAISTNDYKDSGVPLIRIVNLKKPGLTSDDIRYISEELAETVQRSIVRIDDIIFAKTGATVGKCAINDLFDEAVLSSSCVKISINSAYITKYFYYLFCTSEFNYILRISCNGTTRDTINLQPFNNLQCCVPPKNVQQSIANFLDKKIKEIDKLLEIENQQIEKLKGYKQAVITEAVTRGLDKNVPMKESGVEWIGKIPEGWSIQKVLYQLSMPVTDGPHITPELQPEGVAFVSAEAVSCGNGGIDFSHIRGYITEEFYQECCLKYIPEIDDVYMIKSGATTGRVSIVTTLEPKFTIWSPLAVMRCDKNKMIPKFLYYAVQSEQFQRQVALGWSFGTQQNLGMRTLEQMKLIIPSLSEQKDIANYLDTKIGDIEKAIKLKNEKIERLDEYKKSLIYEYVTGKKEVCLDEEK